MGAPIDRTAKTAMDLNLVNGVTSDAPKLKASDNVLYDYVDGLNSAQDAHSAASTLAHPDGSVKTAKIADGAVTTAKIADLNVTTAKIADSAITAAKIPDGTLTAAKFVAGVLTNETANGLEIVALKADIASYGLVKVLTQQMIDDSYAKGILKLPAGTYNISSLTITQPLTIEGNALKTTIIVVDSTLNNVGFSVKNWVNLKDLTLKSAGTKTDGNNVTGILFDKGAGSVGYSIFESVAIQNFSGRGVKYLNAIDVTMNKINSSSNTVGLEFNNAYGSSGSTTINISDLYSSNDTTGILMNKTTTSVLIRPIFELCDYGIDATDSSFTIYSPYYEAVNIYDIRAVDTVITRLGDGRNDKGNSVTWVNQGATSRAGNEFSKYDAITQKLTFYQVKGLSDKTITPYQYINNDDYRWADGMIYDTNRVIPLVAPNNLLSPTGWNYSFNTSKKAVEFYRNVVGAAEYCTQTVNLVAGTYEFIAALETEASQGIARTSSFTVLDSLSNVVYTHDINPLANQSDERFQRLYERFTIASTGDYTIRIREDLYPSKVWLFGACLYRTDRTTSPFTAHDEAMRNSFIMLGHLSGIQSGYNYMGDGKKVEYGTAAPTSGTYKVGDRMKNTTPTAGGYMGWVCITAGTPGTWKGYGAIQA